MTYSSLIFNRFGIFRNFGSIKIVFGNHCFVDCDYAYMTLLLTLLYCYYKLKEILRNQSLFDSIRSASTQSAVCGRLAFS